MTDKIPFKELPKHIQKRAKIYLGNMALQGLTPKMISYFDKKKGEKFFTVTKKDLGEIFSHKEIREEAEALNAEYEKE